MGNRLSKIYTKTGDDGTTGLGDGTRVAKDSARVAAYGTVRWSSGGDWQPARDGQDIAAGDAIRTGPDGSAVVTLANGTRIKLPPSTVLRFDTLSAYAGGLMADTRLRLQRGRITNTVRRQLGSGTAKFQVTTPNATSAVRGGALASGTVSGVDWGVSTPSIITLANLS